MYHYNVYYRALALPKTLPEALECYKKARMHVHNCAREILPVPAQQEKGLLRQIYAAVSAPLQFLEQAELRLNLKDQAAARKAVAENRVDDLVDPLIVGNLRFAVLKDARDRGLSAGDQVALETADMKVIAQYAETRVRHMKMKQDLTR